MTNRGGPVVAGLLLVWIVCLAIPSWGAEISPIRIGIVIDGPWERNDEIRGAIQKEILDLTRGEFDVRFPPDKRIEADWTADGVGAALDRLLADAEVHIVIASGILASNDVCRRGPLPKPVVAPFVLDHRIQGIPLDRTGASGVRNLSYIAFPADIRRDLEIFRDVVPFTRVAFLSSRVVGEAIPELRTNVLQATRDLDVRIDFVPVDPSDESPLEALPADVEAVFVAPLLGLREGRVDRIISGLIERRLPSFSVVGTGDVERGMLVGVAPDFNIPRLSRRVALNVQRILLKEDPATFQVVFTRGERLTINMATAREIGVFPSWKVMTEAELVHQARKEVGRRLTLADAVREAAEVNLDLAARERAVAAGAQEVNGARSALLPQVEVSGLGVVIDDDLGSPQQAERSVSGTARVSQVIFSERAWANLQIQGRLQASRESERDQVRLDIIQEAATAYLNVLRAKTFERVQRDNVRLSRSNLELARVRQAIGFSGPGEVYRWESRIATDQKAAIVANSQRNLAEMALNRAVHRPLEDTFETVEIGLDDPRLMKGQKRLSPYIDNKPNFRIFRRFMVEEGLAASPELKRLDAAVVAQERALHSARRTFFSPTVAARGELTNTFSRGGVGADLPPVGGDLNWSVGVNVSLPIFSGGGRYAALRKAREELAGLRLEREAAAERIEQRIRSAIHVFGASNAGIQLSLDASEAARRNLELTTDAYSRGVVSVLDMLDARNAALASERAAANAVYDCLIDWMEVQRAAGRFTLFMDDRNVDAFFDRLDAFRARPDAMPEGR